MCSLLSLASHALFTSSTFEALDDASFRMSKALLLNAPEENGLHGRLRFSLISINILLWWMANKDLAISLGEEGDW